MNLTLKQCLILSALFQRCYTGRWVDITTDSSSYKKANALGVPITGRDHVIFGVQVCQGAEIQVMQGDAGPWVYYKLGGDSNEWSSMTASEACDGNGCTWLDYVEGVMVDCNVYTALWISWDTGGSHRLGRGDTVGENVIMEGNTTRFDVNFFQVSNFDENFTAQWRFLIDEPPDFIQPNDLGVTIVEVREDADPDDVIFTASGSDPEGDTLTFDLSSHNDLFYFDGPHLRCVDILDFENQSFYNILISMSDGRNVEQAHMRVDVGNIMDEVPVITVASLPSIPEEMPVGSVVAGLFTVDDADQGDVLQYAISGVNSNLFNIDVTSGILTIAERIDRDETTLSSVTFSLHVTDSGGHQATTTLSVPVTDVNDNSPLFSSSKYSVTVAENTPNDESLLDFTVTDLDYGANAEFRISIVDGDDASSKFKVTGSQLMTGPNILDYETASLYTLTIEAVNTDEVRTGTAIVLIQMTAENEHTPVFHDPAVNTSGQFSEQQLPEDVPVNYVIPFTASDLDTGENLIFYISSVLDSNGSDGSSYFNIDQNDGSLRTQRQLDNDAETGGVTYYDVTIGVKDDGNPSRSSEGTIRLTLVNINDNAAQFDSRHYSVSVSEDAGVGKTMGTVTATDIDGDDIAYTIQGTWSSVFGMNGNDVITKVILDYATTQLYVITIRANDGAHQTDTVMTVSVTKTSSAIFEILVNPDVKLLEEQLPGTVISGVFKTVGNTGAVTYSLEGINAEHLSVDPISGELSYGNRRINRDGPDGMLTLTDITLKGIDTSGVATAELSFVIGDLNDNAPTVESLVVYADVRENSADDQLIKSFTLSDVDESSELALSISSGNSGDVFYVAGHVLYVNGGGVDYERDKQYSLVLHATDDSTPGTGLTTAILVNMQVIGENEYGPVWTSPALDMYGHFPDVSILETALIGTTVKTFLAVDEDDGDDGVVVYSVASVKDPSGNGVTGRFTMTSDGRLVVSGQLNFDRDTGGVSHYKVTVTASDKTLTSSATIQVNLLDDPSQTNEYVQTGPSDTSELWVMRSLAVVFGVASLILGSIMFRRKISNGNNTGGKVSPQTMPERPLSVTPQMSLTSVRLEDADDHFSWIEKEEALASQPPSSTKPIEAPPSATSDQSPFPNVGSNHRSIDGSSNWAKSWSRNS